MTTEVRVPALGESVTEATIATWFKKPGDAVAVLARRAEELSRGTGALEQEVEVVLPREADASVHLDRRLRHSPRGVRRARLGHRGGERE